MHYTMSLSCNLRGNAVLGRGLRSLDASYLDVHTIMENIRFLHYGSIGSKEDKRAAPLWIRIILDACVFQGFYGPGHHCN